MINTIIDLFTPKVFIELNKYTGLSYNDLPRDKENKIDIDRSNMNYSYDIRITLDIDNIQWNDEISSIRIIVDKNSYIIQDIYYYDAILKQKYNKIIFSENGYYNEFIE
jgi:hypothetical protein